jgi:hypothetical protein
MHKISSLQSRLFAFSILFPISSLSLSCVTSGKSSSVVNTDAGNATCELPKKRYAWSASKPPKLVWLSLDSLNQAGLEEIAGQLRNPHPRGLKWILQSQNKNPHLTVREPTITSSSHISTISCSTAEVHGIYANSQWNGSKMVSGFNSPFASETFATTLKNSGLKVVTAAYPALDNSESGRQVNEGFAYGDTFGRSQIHVTCNNQPLVHAWNDPNGNLIEEITFKGNDVSETQNFSCRKNKCIFENSAVKNTVDVTVSTTQQKFRAYVQQLPGEKRQVYISPLAANKSFPENVRKFQDDCGAIFSPGKDHSLASFGPEQLIRGFEHRLSHFDWNWAYYLPSTNADVIFLYLEDIDALRHQYSGDTQARDAVARHYERVDAVVGNFLASLPASTNVIVLGDHGMSTISKELNVRKILPARALEDSHIVTSGGTLMLYGRKSQANSMSASPSAIELEWLQSTKDQLTKFKLPDEDNLVFRKVFIKGTDGMKEAGLAHPNAPFLIAFANENYALQNAMTDELILGDITDPKKPAPRPRGQHGHAQESARMKTFLAGWGPVVDSIRLSEVKTNIDLVPTLGKAFAWQIPPQCRSK